MNRRLLVAMLLPVLAALIAGCQTPTATPTVPAAPTEPAPVAGRAQVALKETTHDAGETNYGETRTCPFRVGNSGTAPLRLTLDRRSCSCGEVDVPAEEIPPGGEGTVTIRWSPIPGNVGPYRLTAEVQTNDPETPLIRFEVQGKIVPLVRVLPESWSFIDFSTINPRQVAERELKLISDKLDAFEVKVSASHPGLKWTVSKLEPESGEGGFRAGHAVKLKTSAELPAGYFRETLTFAITTADGKNWNVSIPVYGEVENGVIQVRPREIAFRKPSVREADSKKAHVQFIVPSDDETVEVVKCEPAFLKCDAPKRLKAGLWELTIHLPADNADAAKYQPDSFFEGKILLKVSGSKEPVPVRVKWIGRNE